MKTYVLITVSIVAALSGCVSIKNFEIDKGKADLMPEAVAKDVLRKYFGASPDGQFTVYPQALCLDKGGTRRATVVDANAVLLVYNGLRFTVASFTFSSPQNTLLCQSDITLNNLTEAEAFSVVNALSALGAPLKLVRRMTL